MGAGGMGGCGGPLGLTLGLLLLVVVVVVGGCGRGWGRVGGARR